MLRSRFATLPAADSPSDRSASERQRGLGSRFGAGLWRGVFAVVLGLSVGLAAPAADAKQEISGTTSDVIRVSQLPPEGRTVLAAIHASGPFASKRDGIPFGNREGFLPLHPRGYYAEYTVPTPGARTRGARRIIAGRGATGNFSTSNEYYYTNDHYQSFRRIVQ